MVNSLDEVMEKIMSIKQELDKVEFRVQSTKTHMETIEKCTEKVSKEVIEGFHIVSSKVNHLEEEMKRIEKALDNISKKLK